MLKNKIISIIMPAFNAAAYIHQAIQSVIEQSYPNFELLIINDGSNDNTEMIVKNFDDLRIKYFFQENQGVSKARNTGLKEMKGHYFCFLDADDVMPPDSLLNRLKIFESNADVDFVDGSVKVYDKTLSKLIRIWQPKYQGNPLEDLLRLNGASFFGPSWMVKRKPESTYQFMEGLTHGEDLLFYINLARQGGQYFYTKETVLHYRTGHLSSMRNLKGLENGYIRIYQELMKMKDVPECLKTAYYKKAKIIVWKSFLGHFQLFNAVKAFWRKWNN